MAVLGVLQRLLAGGGDPNYPNLVGNTALHSAAIFLNTETLCLLLAAGAEPNSINREGHSPLHFFVSQCGFIEAHTGAAIQRLLAAGADPNHRKKNGNYPLQEAALWGEVGVLGLLLDAGAEANTQGVYGYTALHLAVTRAGLEMVLLLLQNGARVDIKDDVGDTVIDVARASDNAPILALLQAAGRSTVKVRGGGRLALTLCRRHSKHMLLYFPDASSQTDPGARCPGRSQRLGAVLWRGYGA